MPDKELEDFIVKNFKPSPSRIESNKWIKDKAKDITGDVLSVGARDDRDGLGGFYRYYFTSASTYTTSDIEGMVNIILDVRDMKEIPDDTFNGVFCSGVLEHVDDVHAAVREMHRVMKVGGTLLLGVPFRQPIHSHPHDYWRFTRYGIGYLLKDKFRIEELKEVWPDTEYEFPSAYMVKAIKINSTDSTGSLKNNVKTIRKKGSGKTEQDLHQGRKRKTASK